MGRIKMTAVIIAAAMFISACGVEPPAAVSRATTQRARIGDLVLGLGADGRVALPVSNLNFGVAGTVSKIYVAVGDSVKAGDLLAELEDSNYQFAIASARNNLTKTRTSYDNAVSQYEYSVLSDEKDIKKLQRAITEGFDDYTYQQAISDARAALEKRRAELAKAEAKLENPFDPYTYDNQASDAENTLRARQKSLAEAEEALSGAFDDYSHQNSIAEAEITLQRKLAAIEAAEEEAGAFDGYSYENQILNAEIAIVRRQAEYKDAEEAYYDLYNQAVYDFAVSGSEAEGDKTVSYETQLANALAKMKTAETAIEDAQKTLVNAKNDLVRAKEAYAENAVVKIDNARQSADDAERQLAKLKEDLTRAAGSNEENKLSAVESAREAVETALSAIEKIQADRERAETQAYEDAAEQVKNAVLAIADAELAVTKAETNLERAIADHKKQADDTALDLQLKQISADMNKNSNASISNAEFALQEAELALAEAENNLGQVKLYAPIDGVILSISQGVGERVSAQDNVPAGVMIFGTGGSGSNFMTLCDVTAIYLTASITEGDIIGVSRGQAIRVTIDAIGDEVFYGVVTNVDNIPTTDQNGITTYRVTCLLDDTSGLIKDGMNAYITFVKLEKADVLLIPNRAVFMEDELQYVNIVKEDGTYEKRKVVCGLSDGRQTEVISGVSVNETVLVGRLN